MFLGNPVFSGGAFPVDHALFLEDWRFALVPFNGFSEDGKDF